MIIDAVVGFEQSSYTFREDASVGEICVIVTNPQPTEELAFRITLDAYLRGITACKFIFIH